MIVILKCSFFSSDTAIQMDKLHSKQISSLWAHLCPCFYFKKYLAVLECTDFTSPGLKGVPGTTVTLV